MKEEEILDLIMSWGNDPYAGDTVDLLGAYVRQLSLLSDRLSKDELVELVAIGVGVYQLTLKEFHAGTDAQQILAAIHDRRKKK